MLKVIARRAVYSQARAQTEGEISDTDGSITVVTSLTRDELSTNKLGTRFFLAFCLIAKLSTLSLTISNGRLDEYRVRARRKQWMDGREKKKMKREKKKFFKTR